jgi:preprotein translocase subunit SecE
MNRQMKRMQERQERRAKASPAERREAAATSTRRSAAPTEKKKRAGARQFLKEVRQELRKVDWPSRRELISYTIVVLVTVVVMTTLVFGLDFVFSKLIFNVLTNN